MIKTPYKIRSRDRKASGSPGEQRSRRDLAPRRDGVFRRESATVVHPWMSLPEKLAATQAAMLELAGKAAFECPMVETFAAPAPKPVEEKPRPAAVSIVFRKRRLPAALVPELAAAR